VTLPSPSPLSRPSLTSLSPPSPLSLSHLAPLATTDSSRSQVFCVAACQDDAVELGMADPREEEWRDDIAQRVLLKTGDFFYVRDAWWDATPPS